MEEVLKEQEEEIRRSKNKQLRSSKLNDSENRSNKSKGNCLVIDYRHKSSQQPPS